eukprot:104833-Chlamydomonas_euryale.AAC.1
MSEMWMMFEPSIVETQSPHARQNLKILRGVTLGLWFLFPVAFWSSKMMPINVAVEEWTWTVADFAGKVMFSCSLMYGNFLTIEQRRLIAMRIVEEGNRIQVRVCMGRGDARVSRWMGWVRRGNGGEMVVWVDGLGPAGGIGEAGGLAAMGWVVGCRGLCMRIAFNLGHTVERKGMRGGVRGDVGQWLQDACDGYRVGCCPVGPCLEDGEWYVFLPVDPMLNGHYNGQEHLRVGTHVC